MPSCWVGFHAPRARSRMSSSSRRNTSVRPSTGGGWSSSILVSTILVFCWDPTSTLSLSLPSIIHPPFPGIVPGSCLPPTGSRPHPSTPTRAPTHPSRRCLWGCGGGRKKEKKTTQSKRKKKKRMEGRGEKHAPTWGKDVVPRSMDGKRTSPPCGPRGMHRDPSVRR